MDKSKENALNDFVGDPEEDKKDENKDQKKKVLKSRSGLIERIDRKLVTEDGRQLLREHH